MKRTPRQRPATCQFVDFVLMALRSAWPYWRAAVSFPIARILDGVELRFAGHTFSESFGQLTVVRMECVKTVWPESMLKTLIVVSRCEVRIPLTASARGRTSFVLPVTSYTASALVLTNTSGNSTPFVAARKYLSKPSMEAMNTLEPAGNFGVCAVARELVIASIADTTTKHVRMRPNIRYNPSGVRMGLGEG